MITRIRHSGGVWAAVGLAVLPRGRTTRCAGRPEFGEGQSILAVVATDKDGGEEAARTGLLSRSTQRAVDGKAGHDGGAHAASSTG